MVTHSSILAWKIPWTEEPDGATCYGVTKESDMTLVTKEQQQQQQQQNNLTTI